MHRFSAARLPLALALAALACLAPGAARAASKIKVAAIGDAAPGGGQFAGPALTGAPAAGGNGWVAFRTRVSGGQTSEQIVGTNLTPGSQQRFVVAALGQPAGKRAGLDMGTFKQFLGRPTVNANGDVAFVATLTNSDAIPSGLDNIGKATPAGVFVYRRSAPASQRIQVVALARDVIPGMGELDLTVSQNLLLDTASIDLIERTPAMNDAGTVAFTATTFDETTNRDGAGIFVAPSGGVPQPAIRLGDGFGDRTFAGFGAPAINASGALAFRASLDNDDEGIFKLAAGALTRIAADNDRLIPPEDPSNYQDLAFFGDLVALNDAGDVVFTASGMLDSSTFASSDLETGVVVWHEGSLRLVTYPGREIEGFGRVRGGSLGPDGGGETALPSLEPGGSLHVFVELTGGNGQAFLRANPPDYTLGVPLVVFGGVDPDASPLGGVYFAAGSGAAVDAIGNISFFARLAGAATSEALIFRPVTGTGNSIAIGDATPTKGLFAGPPFSSVTLNDHDDIVFKSFVATGPASLGLFRWRRQDPPDARLTALVRTGDAAPLPGAPLILDLPGEPSLNANGDIAFAALIAGLGRGVLVRRADGTIRAVAMPNDFLTGLAPTETQIEGVAANPIMLTDGSVVFRGTFAYQDPIDFFRLIREEGLFRVDTAGTLTLLARTTQDSPTGERYFRFRDPGTAGGNMIVFRAPLGDVETVNDPDLLPIGLFLIDPQSAISTVVLQNQDLGGGLPLEDLTGRAGVDLAGNVGFLAKVGFDEQAAVIRRMNSGAIELLAAVGRAGPTGGTYRSLGRPAMSSAGHLAYRASFERFLGGSPGFFLVTDGAPRPMVEIGEGDDDGAGGRLTSLSAAGALNASDHLAFIASVSAGKSRNGIFLAAPTTTEGGKLTIRRRTKKIDGFESDVGTTKGRFTMRFGDLGGKLALSEQSVSIVCNDATGLLFSATIPKGGMAKRGASWSLRRRAGGLRRLQVRPLGRKGAKIAFTSAPWDASFRFGVPPISVRVDAGSHSANAVFTCVPAAGGKGVDCSGS